MVDGWGWLVGLAVADLPLIVSDGVGRVLSVPRSSQETGADHCGPLVIENYFYHHHYIMFGNFFDYER